MCHLLVLLPMVRFGLIATDSSARALSETPFGLKEDGLLCETGWQLIDRGNARAKAIDDGKIN